MHCIYHHFINILFNSSHTREPFRCNIWHWTCDIMNGGAQAPWQTDKYWQHAKVSHKCKIEVSDTHIQSKCLHISACVQTQWFIYIKSMTQDRLPISMQNGPKTSNGRLYGGRERSHIKGINQRHNFGSTWVIFHFKHIAKHLVLNSLVLHRLLLFQLASLMSLHTATNGTASTAVHEVPVSFIPQPDPTRYCS